MRSDVPETALRALGIVERLRVRRGRCPTCRGRLARFDLDETSSWIYRPEKYLARTRPVGRYLGVLTLRTHNAEHRTLRSRICPACRLVFSGGFVHPLRPADTDRTRVPKSSSETRAGGASDDRRAPLKGPRR